MQNQPIEGWEAVEGLTRFSSLRGLMAEAAEAPLGDVPMLHTGELVASDAAATAHRAPSLELSRSRSVWRSLRCTTGCAAICRMADAHEACRPPDTWPSLDGWSSHQGPDGSEALQFHPFFRKTYCMGPYT